MKFSLLIFNCDISIYYYIFNFYTHNPINRQNETMTLSRHEIKALTCIYLIKQINNIKIIIYIIRGVKKFDLMWHIALL